MQSASTLTFEERLLLRKAVGAIATSIIGVFLIFVAIWDLNGNLWLGVVGWIILQIVLLLTGIPDRVFPEGNWDWESWKSWFIIPGSLFLTVTISLFFVGGWGARFANVLRSPVAATYYSLRSGREVSIRPIEATTFHVPFLQTVAWWVVDNTIYVETTAQTADGKTVIANASAEVSIDGGARSIEDLVRNFGDQQRYKEAVKAALREQLKAAIGIYTLETLPKELTLEDLVGTNLGLEGLDTRWSGKMVVSDLHRYANSP